MITLFLLLFTTVCVFLLLQGMLKRGAVYGYPFLAGAVFVGWVLPQLVGLSHEQYLPPGAVGSTVLMATLCAAMCWLGATVAHPPHRKPIWNYDDRRLLVVSAVLSLLGGYFYYAISRLPPEMTETSTGLPVAYYFFARMLTYGFAIAVLMLVRNGSRVACLIALYGALFFFDRIVINGRRQDTGEFVMIILLAWWFQRDRCIPRPLMLAGVVIGSLLINSIGDYRDASKKEEGPKWDEIANIDFVGNLQKITEQGGPELMNAAYIIAAVGRTMDFDVGTSHWNALMYAYVPAQLVGTEFKEALYLPQSTNWRNTSAATSPAYDEFFYTPVPGSTVTGFADAYASFWYFGCLEFFGIAYCMQKLWWAARGGSFVAQLLYMLMPINALEAITHGTDAFVVPWVHMAIFLLPGIYLARRRKTASEPHGGHQLAGPRVVQPRFRAR
jgi:hypothetical protein